MSLIPKPSLSKYVYAIILFTLVTVSGISMFALLGDDNPSMLTDDKFGEFNESMNQLAAVTAQHVPHVFDGVVMRQIYYFVNHSISQELYPNLHR